MQRKLKGSLKKDKESYKDELAKVQRRHLAREKWGHCTRFKKLSQGNSLHQKCL